MITCIIPAYNEAQRIHQVVTIALEAKREGLIHKVIVVSDGSTDGTAQLAEKAGADEVITYPKNGGKGYAVLTGLRSVPEGDVLLLDADILGWNLDHFRSLLTAAEGPGVLMVIGYLSNDLRQQMLPLLSGQRILKRKLVDAILGQKWDRSRYTIEILMNRLADKLKGTTVMVPLTGLNHLKKEHKYSNYRALYHKFLFSFGMANLYKIFLVIFLVVGYVALIVFTPLWPRAKNLSAMQSISAQDRILVVVAHPDDEAIGAGGLMYDASQKGAHVAVVVVSSGDANKFSAGVESKTIFPSKTDLIKEGDQRLTESKTALAALGVTTTYYLGFPDRVLKDVLTTNWDTPLTSKYSGLSSNQYPGTYKPNAPYDGSELLSELKSIVSQEKPTIIITHMKEDTNSDHQTVATFTGLAADELSSREVVTKPVMYGFLVHWRISEFPRPFRKATNFPLNPPNDLLKACAWESYPLSKSTQNQKWTALQDYRSQLTSPFLKGLLDALDRTNELFCPKASQS